MNEQRYYVYEYYIVPTKEIFYVGKGTGDRYKTVKGRNKYFTDMFNSHKCAVRIFSKNLTEEEAYQIEYLRIQFLRKYTPFRLTNQTEGGDGIRGFKPSCEQIEKARKAMIKKWQDEEWKMRQIKKRHSPNSAFQSQEFKNKISQLVQGKKNPNYGHKWSDKMKNNLRQKQIASKRYCGSRNPNAKKVVCIDTGDVFETMTDAAKFAGVKLPSSIYHAIRRNSTAGGFHWKILDK